MRRHQADRRERYLAAIKSDEREQREISRAIGRALTELETRTLLRDRDGLQRLERTPLPWTREEERSPFGSPLGRGLG